ncbi:CPBP family intramembrane glutamic endopeptidase [Halococcus hamelinensis]|uniref:CPBP family intramembrane glutamic endopeptidase n=1 Tax=Halococcus hamelinensis TaxID=332168 RepID=UPI000B2CB8FB|nr:CPBP family intramembrane glutamic endopeptidase [Halococcus hamelinensis]
MPAEELFYRNIIQKWLGEHFPSVVAVVAAAVLFALSHIPTYYNSNLILMISPFASNLIGGLVYGSIYARTRSVVPPILAHALYNAIGIGLAVI